MDNGVILLWVGFGDGVFYIQVGEDTHEEGGSTVCGYEELFDFLWYVMVGVVLYIEQVLIPCLACLSLAVVVATLINAVMCYRNFGKGLKQHLSNSRRRDVEEQDTEIPSVEPSRKPAEA